MIQQIIKYVLQVVVHLVFRITSPGFMYHRMKYTILIALILLVIGAVGTLNSDYLQERD